MGERHVGLFILSGFFGRALQDVWSGFIGSRCNGRAQSLRQGSRPLADYAIDFRTLAYLSDWNSAALCDAFRSGFAPYIKDELVSFDLLHSLDRLIELTS